jgi:hypothetical protein
MAEIYSPSISCAWLRALSFATKSCEHEISPLAIVIAPIQAECPQEDLRVRNALDAVLGENGRPLVETVSGTIFPRSLWNPDKPRADLFRRYMKILPKVRRYPQNRRGVYFERFISYPGTRGQLGRNQLDHIIRTYRMGNHRRSALQLGVFVPETDLNDSRQLGFPCLQQVAFAPDAGRGTLAVTGFYAMQHLFQRAYGNYLGLTRLGEFVAHEMGLVLDRVVCIAAVARLEVPLQTVYPLLEQFPGPEIEV